MNRIVLIGLDGVPYSFIKNLMLYDSIPNISELVEKGVFYRTFPSIPEVSSVAWSSIVTGSNPGEHSVYGFTDVIPGTYSLRYHNVRWLKVKPFWANNSNRYVVINVPATFPAQPLNGVMVTGFISPDLRRAVYPPKLLKVLQEIDYKIDVDLDMARKSGRLLIDQLFKTLRIRTALYRYLWNSEAWDVFMFVITGTDRLGHFLWSDHHDKSSPYHDAIIQYYKAIDHIIGEIHSRLSDRDTLAILSDHGMTSKKGNIYINPILEEKGILIFKDGEKKLTNIDPSSKAFALDDGRIYIHYQGKYPEGSVPPEKREDVVGKILEALDDVVVNGEKPFMKIFKREDIYYGPYIENAPDLIISPREGYNLLAGFGKDNVFDLDHLKGTHNYDSFLILNKPNLIDEGRDIHIYDIIRILGLKGEEP